MVELKLDGCSYEAAKYAVEHWHYSRSLPASKKVKIGAWENGSFVGCVIYAWGSNQNLGTAYGLTMSETAELCRVALGAHETPTSRIVAISLKLLQRQCPGLRLVVSYADRDQGHHGGIYAAGNWVYVGMVQENGGTPKYLIHGKVVHGRSVNSRYGTGSQNLAWLRTHVDPNAEHIFTKGKHKYLYGLDEPMRQQIAALAKPYPKRTDETP